MTENFELPRNCVEWRQGDTKVRDEKILRSLASFVRAKATPYIAPPGSAFGGATDVRSVMIIPRSMRGHWEVCFNSRIGMTSPREGEEVASRFTNDLEGTMSAAIQWLAGHDIDAVLAEMKSITISADQIGK